MISRLNKKNIFLFDGVGAIISMLLTGVVLPFFSTQIGLTTKTLYFLASFPLVYSIISLSCFFLIKETKGILKLIILLNCLYCIISALTITFVENITSMGMRVLSIEILVIAIVVLIEIKVYRTSPGS